MPEHKTSPSGEIELFATAPPPSTKPKKKKKRKKFADWYDNEIAAVLDDEEPNNRSQTDGSCCEYNDDDDSSSSDYSEGLALLQSSLDTLEIDEETNHWHMFSCCGFWWHRMWNCHWLGSTDLRFSIRKEDEDVFAVGGRGILEYGPRSVRPRSRRDARLSFGNAVTDWHRTSEIAETRLD